MPVILQQSQNSRENLNTNCSENYCPKNRIFYEIANRNLSELTVVISCMLWNGMECNGMEWNDKLENNFLCGIYAEPMAWNWKWTERKSVTNWRCHCEGKGMGKGCAGVCWGGGAWLLAGECWIADCPTRNQSYSFNWSSSFILSW